MRESTLPTDALVSQLEQYSTCDLADALGQLDLAGFIPDITVRNIQDNPAEARVAGPVFTVEMVDRHHESVSTNHFADEVPPGAVLFVNAPSHATCAVVGGLVASAVHARKARGIIVNGRVRDITELQQLPIPIFAKGTSCMGARGRLRQRSTEADLPRSTVVHFNGQEPIVVTTDDFIMADVNGVVCVPRQRVQEVVRLCSRNATVEAQCMEHILNGGGFQEALKKYRSPAPR
ncbi:hypothetical protein IWQ62_002753 [Dispira parvispora]|uniref:RraA-like protein n=1 Tax=Dispira parvispora TaxID=1520584 RepID=A0A9W8AV32_9FUNG|nr:hypothetical protein IWQ62_002753 [Dispira parvispora]